MADADPKKLDTTPRAKHLRDHRVIEVRVKDGGLSRDDVVTEAKKQATGGWEVDGIRFTDPQIAEITLVKLA